MNKFERQFSQCHVCFSKKSVGSGEQVILIFFPLLVSPKFSTRVSVGTLLGRLGMMPLSQRVGFYTWAPFCLDHARQLTKNMMRKPTADRLLKQRDADIQNFVSFISRDSIQKSLQMYLEKLKQKKG